VDLVAVVHRDVLKRENQNFFTNDRNFNSVLFQS